MKKIAFILSAALFLNINTFAMPKDSFTFADEDFEEYAEGTKLSETGSEGLTVKDETAGDSVTIEKDPISGTNAVRIKQAHQEPSKNSNPETGFTISFDPITQGIAEVGFSIRAESFPALFNNAFVLTSTGSRVGTYYHYKDSLFINGMGNYLTTLGADSYVKFNIKFDFTNNKYQVVTTKNGRDTVFDAKATLDNISAVSFLIAANWRDGSDGWIDKSDKDAVYWIDDVYVRQQGVSLVKFMPEKEADIDADITAEFNVGISETSAKSNISVLENGSLIENDKYEIAVDDKTVKILPLSGLEYNSEYKVVIKKGLQSTEENYLPTAQDNEYTFRTKRMFGKIENLEDGGVYSKITPILPKNEKGEISAMLTLPDGTEGEFTAGTEITELGDYILSVTGTDLKTQKTQTDIYKFSVVGEVAPTAEDVKISIDGDIAADSVLSGSYIYKDINDKPGEEKEGKSKYKWYAADSEDGVFEPIDGADGMEYKIGENDLNKYFKFSVTPVSTEAPYEGEEVMSGIFTGFFLPEVQNVKIIGEAKEDSILSAEFDYIDRNNQDKKEEKYAWYKSTDLGKTYTKIGEESTYKVTRNDTDCIIRVGVTPEKSTATGKESYSAPIYGLMKPTVKDVKISGEAKVDQTIFVTYNYEDLNGDEVKCSVKWYVDGKFESDGESLTLTSSMSGDKVYAEVTPVSENYPYNGDAVKSDSVTVSPKPAKGGTGGTKGGGGAAYTPPQKEPEKSDDGKKPDEKPTGDTNEEKEIFTDISEHWAKEQILKMYEKGIVNGMGDKKFLPDSSITRAQFAAMISKAFPDREKIRDVEFDDVKSDKWYHDAVKDAADKGMMSGSNGFFRPDDKITREEICVAIANICTVDGEYSDAGFADGEDISAWAKNAVNFAKASALVSGKGDNLFKPKDNATRAESLVIILRVLENSEVEHEQVQ